MKMARILFGVLILLPVAVGVQKQHSDSLFTDLTFGTGAGSYAGRYYTRSYSPGSGCDGGGGYQYVEHRKKIDFQDAGFGIDHQVSKSFRLGFRTGYISDKRVKYFADDYSKFRLQSTTSWIFNPYFSVEGSGMGFGLGPVISGKGIYYPSSKAEDYAHGKFTKKALASYHARFGSPKAVYASVSRLENVPLVSGGGYLNYGLGTEAIPYVSLWVGGSTGPFDGHALLVKAGAKLSPNWTVYSAYRSGTTHGDGAETIGENAFSLRLNYRFFRK
jgi:hypothetical protein